MSELQDDSKNISLSLLESLPDDLFKMIVVHITTKWELMSLSLSSTEISYKLDEIIVPRLNACGKEICDNINNLVHEAECEARILWNKHYVQQDVTKQNLIQCSCFSDVEHQLTSTYCRNGRDIDLCWYTIDGNQSGTMML